MVITQTNFSKWFNSVAGKPPFPYQERLATALDLPYLLNVPTGSGKTAAVVLGWLWRRCKADKPVRKETPRRLVYCLPMRTLVEQTYGKAKLWLQNANLDKQVDLYLLMGGVLKARWETNLDKDSILIGTQDQLISRALNRGYGMSRYSWPIPFALLNTDCLWVMDEVQLMGAGLRTTAQLQGFRETFGTYGSTKSLWMSATLDSDLLQTVNYQPDLSNTHQLSNEDRAHQTLQPRMQARKKLIRADTVLSGKEDTYAQELAREVDQVHVSGSLTIVICNRVSRAQAVYRALKQLTEHELLLIHSRFRPKERRELNNRLQDSKLSGILVATQAIEAGVDISARTLFTELAPWSSLVQRFGRCNRYGESPEASVYWVDSDLIQKETASPYEIEELEIGRSCLNSLPKPDVGPESLQSVKAPKQEAVGLIPRRDDLLQLFDTSTDLAGHDIDVSSFIRETEDIDIAIAWRKLLGSRPPSDMGALQQDELCRVSLRGAKDFLAKLKQQNRQAWFWDGLRGEWVEARNIYPGLSLLVDCTHGGYCEEMGFTGETSPSGVEVVPVEVDSIEPDQDAADLLTNVGQYITLLKHSQDVADEVRRLCSNLAELGLPIDLVELLERAGRWHDLGKSHKDFQEMLVRERPDKLEGGPWAKSDYKTQMRRERRGFRHELVSALVALQQGEPFLLTYLVAAHHGRVRMTIQPRPTEKAPSGVERYALGVWQGDEVPAVNLGNNLEIPPQRISLECMELGEGEHGESWAARAIALLEEYGPFKLAFLETIIRLADWRASANAENKDV